MANHDYPLTQEEFEEIYSKVPRITVELILRTDKGVVLTKRAIEPYVGMWHIPGGTVYYKETLEDAVIRVAKDELGVDVEIVKHLGFIHYPDMIKDVGWGWPIGAAFEVKKVVGEFETDDQGDEIGFFQEVPENIIPKQGEFLDEKVFITSGSMARESL